MVVNWIPNRCGGVYPNIKYFYEIRLFLSVPCFHCTWKMHAQCFHVFVYGQCMHNFSMPNFIKITILNVSMLPLCFEKTQKCHKNDDVSECFHAQFQVTITKFQNHVIISLVWRDSLSRS